MSAFKEIKKNDLCNIDPKRLIMLYLITKLSTKVPFSTFLCS